MASSTGTKWQIAPVSSPLLGQPISVVVARDIPYILNGNRFQTFSIYLPPTASISSLVGTPVTTLPHFLKESSDDLPDIQVHIHGGAWRDPNLTSASIEATVAHAFSNPSASPISAIISINYTLSPFPSHPTLPYDPTKNNHSDPSREATHPDHIHDILKAFVLLRKLGLQDDTYILTGHSAGACLAAQASLLPSSHWNLEEDVLSPPRPAALLGMNGLYDLPGLVHDLGVTHAHLKDVYANLIGIAFGDSDESEWADASPAKVDVTVIKGLVETGKAPKIVVLDQSKEDQLVPFNQLEKLKAQLQKVDGLKVIEAEVLKGLHATPWEEGLMLWESVLNVLSLLREE